MRASSVVAMAASLLAGTIAASANLANLTNPRRTIEIGTVIGTATTMTQWGATSAAYQYLGILLAAAPTGTLRLAPPASPNKLSELLRATTLPTACFQLYSYPQTLHDFELRVFNNPNGPPPAESEDCLFLNVYAPRSASATNKKPVLFWLFGGDHKFGTASIRCYNGTAFAAFQDIVVVIINFRNDIFGFSSSPQIPLDEQNMGYRDQRLALD